MKTRLLYLLLILAALPVVSAQIELDHISTDPQVIAAGDSVDVFVEYSVSTTQNERYSNPEWEFRVQLLGDDDLTSEYVRVTDRYGDDVFGTLRAGGQYSKQFALKIDEQAPTGEYEFMLRGQWYRDGEPVEGYQQRRFSLDVKKRGILLDVAQIKSEPARLHPGDREAALTLSLANSGEKPAVSTKLVADLPRGMTPSFSSSSRAYAGTIAPGQQQEATLHIDLDKDLPSGEYLVEYAVSYLDESQNTYSQTLSAPLYVSEKPRLEVIDARMSAAQGSTGTLTVRLRNVGDVSAEAIDVRLLKESNQPFTLDTRSGYIGELAPNQTGTVSLEVGVARSALNQTYSVPILVRAKGDSDENDNTIYTYRDDAQLTVTQASTQPWVLAGLALVVIIGGVFVWRKYRT